MLLTIPLVGLDAALRLLAGSPASGVAVRLFRNAAVPSKDSVLTDLLEANYSLYAPATAIAWTSPAFLANEDCYMETPLLTFTRGAGAVDNFIYGVYLTIEDTGGPRLIALGRYDSPKSMVSPGNKCFSMPRLKLRRLPF